MLFFMSMSPTQPFILNFISPFNTIFQVYIFPTMDSAEKQSHWSPMVIKRLMSHSSALCLQLLTKFEKIGNQHWAVKEKI